MEVLLFLWDVFLTIVWLCLIIVGNISWAVLLLVFPAEGFLGAKFYWTMVALVLGGFNYLFFFVAEEPWNRFYYVINRLGIN